MILMLDEITKTIRDYAAARPEIIAAYLFGSVLRRANPNDIDVAFLVRSDAIDESEYPFGYLAGLASDLMAAMHRSDVDVVILNQASPLLCMQVLRTGRPVFSRNEEERLRYEQRVRDRYIDTAPLRRIKEHYLRKRYLVYGR
jgi:predicted nucleotidyltransferase